eukprot:g21690.t1
MGSGASQPEQKPAPPILRSISTAQANLRKDYQGDTLLSADVGGTGSRLHLFLPPDSLNPTEADFFVPPERMIFEKQYKNERFESFMDVVRLFLQEAGLEKPPLLACLAVAGVVVDNSARFVNLGHLALRSRSPVVTWGAPEYGGDSSAVRADLRDVRAIQASSKAFAAITMTGQVVTWGDECCGGDSSTVQEVLKDVEQIQATKRAFAALLKDGSVITWGDPEAGGDSSFFREQLKGVQKIQASSESFAAILADGAVVTWGSLTGSVGSSLIRDELNNIQHIQSTWDAFAGIRSDGSVVTWGSPIGGGAVPSSVKHRLKEVIHVQATLQAFAALTREGSAFAALTKDGEVVTWGSPCSGGDSLRLRGRLDHVVDIQATKKSFAAIKDDGTVQTWGHLADDVEVKETDCEILQDAPIKHGAPIAVIGAGTGLGEAFLTVGAQGDYEVWPSEGGHAEYAPRQEGSKSLETELLQYLTIKYSEKSRVSVERVAAGRGTRKR